MKDKDIQELKMIQPCVDSVNMVKFCKNCGCSNFKNKTTDFIEHIVCEQEIICKNCDTVVNYWFYGHFQNHDFMDDEYYRMERQKKIERIINGT